MTAPRPHRALGRLLDASVLLVVVALLALPFAARAATADSGLPPAPAADADAGPTTAVATGPVPQNMPMLSDGPTARLVQDPAVLADPEALHDAIIDLAAQLFGGKSRADAFWQVLTEHTLDFYPYESTLHAYRYPYRYEFLDPLLDNDFPADPGPAQADLANDLAGLLILFGANTSRDSAKAAHQTAGAAYALLDRLRATDKSCRVQLNLAFLVSLASLARDEDIADEFAKAHDACPGDPTPLWLFGHAQSARAFTNPTDRTAGSLHPSTPDEIGRAFATFRQLQKEMPGSAAGWAGEADAEIAQADQAGHANAQPFTARNRYAHAVALYRHAATLSDDPGIDAGLARAYAGLSRFDEAVAAARAGVAKSSDAAGLRAIEIDMLERAGRYADAAALAGQSADKAGPSGRWLITQGKYVTTPSVSLGFAGVRAVDLTVGYEVGQGGGAYAYDTSFVPVFRPDYGLTGHYGWCPQWTVVRDSILAGKPSDAVAAFQAAGTPADPDYRALCPAEEAAHARSAFDTNGFGYLDVELRTLAAIVAAEAGEQPQQQAWLDAIGRLNPDDLTAGDVFTRHSPEPLRAYVFDHWQNLWRFGGDLGHARKVVDAWLSAIPNDPTAQDRAGELAFLGNDYRRAADYFRSAAPRLDGADRALEMLKLGSAQGFAGDTAAARDSLTQATSLGRAAYTKDSSAIFGALAAYFAQCQLGDIALRIREYAQAVTAYNDAIRQRDELLSDEYTAFQLFGLEKGAEENNLALAHILLKSGAEAEKQAALAVSRDAQSPIFAQTLAYAYQSKGEWEKSAATYRSALDADPTLFPAANDLGVILARQGKAADAVAEFRRAIGAKPTYALGWFNLGVQLGTMGPSHFLEAQGALGRAVALDAGLRDRDRELVFDTDPYYSGLDLSRPLPATWRFAQHEHRAPVALTIFAILVLIGRLAWNLGLDKVTGSATEKALGWLSWLRRPFVPAIAVTVLIGLFLWPLIGSPGVSVTEIAVIGAGILGLTGIYVRSRVLAARRSNLPVRHFTWLPSLAIGVALTAVGLSFATVPAAELPEERRTVRWIGPAMLAVFAAALLGIAAFTGVPATRALGSSAVVMLGSVLLPLRPFDGSYLRGKVVSLLISLAMLAVSIALFLDVL